MVVSGCSEDFTVSLISFASSMAISGAGGEPP